MPSGEPVKEDILQNLKTTIEGIAAGGDYYTDVREVSLLEAEPTMVSQYPCAIISPLGTEYDHPGTATMNTITGHYRVRATLLVRTRTNAALSIERFVRDVQKSILIDITRGGNAIDTYMTSDDVFYPTELDEPVAGADCVILVHYRTLRTDLNTPT